jgi:hypothetical protein
MPDVFAILTAELPPAQGSTTSQMLPINGIQSIKHGIETVLAHDKLLSCEAHGLGLELLLQGFTDGGGQITGLFGLLPALERGLGVHAGAGGELEHEEGEEGHRKLKAFNVWEFHGVMFLALVSLPQKLTHGCQSCARSLTIFFLQDYQILFFRQSVICITNKLKQINKFKNTAIYKKRLKTIK